MSETSLQEMALLIAGREFDSSKIGQTPYLEWNGRDAVDCAELERLVISYDFNNMKTKAVSQLKLNKIQDQIRLYQIYRQKNKRIPRALLSLLFLFITILVLFSADIVSNYIFYGSIVLFYLFSINYPVVIRKRIRKYRYLNL